MPLVRLTMSNSTNQEVSNTTIAAVVSYWIRLSIHYGTNMFIVKPVDDIIKVIQCPACLLGYSECDKYTRIHLRVNTSLDCYIIATLLTLSYKTLDSLI